MDVQRCRVVSAIAVVLALGATAHPAPAAAKKKAAKKGAPTSTTVSKSGTAKATTTKAAAGATSTPTAAATGSEDVLGTGSFRRVMYDGGGSMTIAKKGSAREVRLSDDFKVQSGPALRVYLSAAAVDAGSDQIAKADFVDLGMLSSLKGAQTYAIPADTDLAKYKSVVVWCQKFSLAFVAAPIG